MSFEPDVTVTHAITADLTRIERARGFLEAATLSEDWIRQMGARALVLEAHHTTHIEGTKLTLEESELTPRRRGGARGGPGRRPRAPELSGRIRVRFHLARQRWADHRGAGPGDPQAPRRGRPRRVCRAGGIPADPELCGELRHRRGRVHAASGVRRPNPDARAGRLAEPGTGRPSSAGQRNRPVPTGPHPPLPGRQRPSLAPAIDPLFVQGRVRLQAPLHDQRVLRPEPGRVLPGAPRVCASRTWI